MASFASTLIKQKHDYDLLLERISKLFAQVQCETRHMIPGAKNSKTSPSSFMALFLRLVFDRLQHRIPHYPKYSAAALIQHMHTLS